MGSSSSEKTLTPRSADLVVLSGISQSFDWLSPTRGQITHIFLTRAPLVLLLVRLACIRHAASVCSEPESNSPVKKLLSLNVWKFFIKTVKNMFEWIFPPKSTLDIRPKSFSYLVFKEPSKDVSCKRVSNARQCFFLFILKINKKYCVLLRHI